ncbi:MAG: Gfo/Idh/MocA family oxidoreductase [Bryobacterales bacterium]
MGNAPKVPFDKERFFRWRRYWDYSGGIATDLFYHHITPLIHVLGREFPIRAVGSGGNYFTPKQVMQVPDTFVITLDFPGQYTLVCGGSLNNSVELPIVIRGNEADIHFHGGSQMRPDYILIEPEDPYRDDFKDKVVRSGLDKMGRWIEEKGERVPDFRGQPARPRTNSDANATGRTGLEGARYDEYVKKDRRSQNPALPTMTISRGSSKNGPRSRPFN